jgi:SAM-dependent methyltransferase
MLLIQTLVHMKRRRTALRTAKLTLSEEELQESCIPSYKHRNWAASFVAWSRLIAAAQLAERFASRGPVLDFGSGSGELALVIKPRDGYFFVEESDALAALVASNFAEARKIFLSEMPQDFFGTIFCLDSLEHNSDFPALIDQLWSSLRAGGTLILSGPTENWLYRLGRRIAGFSGHYHKTNVLDIEREFRLRGRMVARHLVPFGAPLFALSAWKKESGARHRQEGGGDREQVA